MLDSLNDKQKKAMARVALGIMGISYGGRIRTNEPDLSLLEAFLASLLLQAVTK